VTVPEAAVDKQHGPELWKDQVGFPGQVTHLKAVPQAGGMQDPADSQLRLRILSPDVRHVQVTLLRGQDVRGHAVCATGTRSSAAATMCAEPAVMATMIFSAIALDISGGTALPICLKAGFIVPLNTKPSGKLCRRAASRTLMVRACALSG